jgi:hypothetical protein
VTLPAEVLDLLDMVLQDGRLGTLVVSIKLGKVVNLDVILDRLGQSVGSERFPSGTLK